jgi:hypothetical protein
MVLAQRRRRDATVGNVRTRRLLTMRNPLSFRIVSSLLAAAAIVASNTGASAAGTFNTVMEVGIEAGAQVARLGMNGGPFGTGRPGCHNVAYNSYWAFDISTAKGKAMLATAQAALLSGKRLNVFGGTGCTNIAASGTINVETVTSMILVAN